ncbi:glycosyltransferase involved in cell wall biosynthesis [Williamsia limnetica]|uniref:Glycosyltransferase involved in cell wall biosynthesis n=1 Tax=Williamsia limnetica TaxID=882452 RepID=A0A318RMS6_WILLI|nr:glycosyltransferase [Williamsia limnetica]PYE17453.1 glycosyltransferase involved in cell wall biosynthesis [Williamsia limnetica]
MKIAMISEHASPLATLRGVDAGGQNVHVAELSAALCRSGHDVLVYTRRDDPQLETEVIAPAGYRVVHVPAGPASYLPKDQLLEHMPEFSAFIADHWEHERPDIVHAHFWMSGVAAHIAARRTSLPVIQTFHALGSVKKRFQGAADTSPQSRLATEEQLARDAAYVAATCSDEVFELVRMGLPRSQAVVVPCGVDVNAFTPTGPVAERNRRHRLVTAGRLVPRKGFDIAIRALADIPDTELVIAGGPMDGELEDDAEARRLLDVATEVGVRDRVIMPGSVSRADIPALFRSADAVVCVPWYEPFGMVPIEAMACGRPVIAAAVGGMLDTVVDGRTGRLVPARDPQSLAASASALLAAEDERREFGNAARARACKRYSWDRVAAETLRLYRKAIPDSAVARDAR